MSVPSQNLELFGLYRGLFSFLFIFSDGFVKVFNGVVPVVFVDYIDGQC